MAHGDGWDVTVTTPDELASLARCTVIGENLRIECADCNDLRPLSNIRTITGNLLMFYNQSLVSLDGLENVTRLGYGEYIGGHLSISFNPRLPDCEVCGFLDQLPTAPNEISVAENLQDSCTPVPANCP